MNKFFKFFSLVLVTFFITFTNVEAAKKVVAVMDVSYHRLYEYNWNTVVVEDAMNKQLAADEFRSGLETALVNNGSFVVVERSRLNSVVKELGLQQTGLIDTNSAVELGKMSGAELTVVGEVVGANVGLANKIAYKSITAKVEFIFKVIDNKTGIIKIQENVKGSKSIMQTENYDEKILLSGAVKEAVKNAVDKLTELNPVSGAVMKVAGEQLYVNLGSEHGIHVGDFFVIYKEGEPLLDPMGNILGVAEEEIARASAIDVKQNYCVLRAKKMKGALSNRCKARKVVKK